MKAVVFHGVGDIRLDDVPELKIQRIINGKTARSQFIGGMTMGLGMALHEESLVDERFGHMINHDLAEYHIPTNADVGDIDVAGIDEEDPYVNPMVPKG